jgi:hypothetical protein
LATDLAVAVLEAAEVFDIVESLRRGIAKKRKVQEIELFGDSEGEGEGEGESPSKDARRGD